MKLEDYSRQGEMAAIDNLNRAIKDVNEAFNDPNYAKEHPELVGQIVLAAAIDYSGTLLHVDMEKLTSKISELSNKD